MMTVKEIVEKEIAGIKKNIINKPKITSPYGKAYWTGNMDALKWTLKKIDEVRTSASTMIKEEK